MEINRKVLEILEEKGLIRIGELADLTGRIAIDAEQWLETILPKDEKSSMMGSISMSLRPSIQEEVSRLQALNENLSLMFVFPGIPLFEKANIGENKLWSSNSLEKERCLKGFPRKYLEFPYVLVEILKHLRCETFQAPYLPSAQMAYFLKEGICNDLVGGCDLLFYPVSRIITEIMHTKYKYVKTQEVFETLAVSPVELKQVFILSGYLARFDIDIPIGNLMETIKYVRLEELTNEKDLSFVEDVFDVIETSATFALQPPGLLYESHSRLLGNKLPRDFYFAFCNSQISRHNFTLIAFNRFFEKHPVADSNNYRRMLRSLKDLKAVNISVLYSCLPIEYRRAPVKVQYWYSEIEDEVSSKTDSFINWKVTKASLSQALSDQKKNFADLQFCMKWHSDDFMSSKQLMSNDVCLEADIEVLHTKVLLTFLECTSYIYPKGLPTLFGSSFLKVDPEWQSSAFYLQELLKYGMLNGRTLSQTQCMQLTDEEFQKRCLILTDDSSRHAIFLISRVFSLVQPTLNEEVWNGEVDYDLAQFHSLVYAIFKNYQQLYEAIVLKEFVNSDVLFKNALDLCQRSPLLPLPNPALGIAVKKLFIVDNVEQVAKEMPHMTDLLMDLQRGWMFWKNFVKIMGIFKQHGAVPENNFFNEITYASKKLKEVLIRARIKFN
jgi:hypothetical protein